MSYKSRKMSYHDFMSKICENHAQTTIFAKLCSIENQRVNNSLITHLRFLYNK